MSEVTASAETTDVLVLGTGNAGLSAALAAAEGLQDASASPVASAPSRAPSPSVLVVDRCPRSWAGGNTAFTAGAYRTAFASVADVLSLVTDLDAAVAAEVDIPVYDADAFRADLQRVTDGRCNARLATQLVAHSFATTRWLAQNHGVRFELALHRQAYRIANRWRFWGGLVLAVQDGGRGLTAAQMRACERLGVQVRFNVDVLALLGDAREGVTGVRVREEDGRTKDIYARKGVVLCAGGFEASTAMRVAHLGDAWQHAYVRGTPYNTGAILQMAMDFGAQTAGDWSGCHATCWDANARPDCGDQARTNQFTKSGYPLGIMVNVHGRRFVNEGLDLRNYTYAKFGRAILGQPGGAAFQVWDADGAAWLRKEEYAADVVERITADSIRELAVKLEAKGLQDPAMFEKTVRDYNEAVKISRKEHPEWKFDPSVLDGLSTRSLKGGLGLNKTNWAIPITKPPFLAVKVACGVTFTFAGLAVDPDTAGVLASATGRPIPGLFCAGEMLGGLFYGNYPGGSGLTAGAVFGRKAGRAAASRPA